MIVRCDVGGRNGRNHVRGRRGATDDHGGGGSHGYELEWARHDGFRPACTYGLGTLPHGEGQAGTQD